MEGCRCPRCLPLFKGRTEADHFRAKSRTLLAQSRKSQQSSTSTISRSDSRRPAVGVKAEGKAVRLRAAQEAKTQRSRREGLESLPRASRRKGLASGLAQKEAHTQQTVEASEKTISRVSSRVEANPQPHIPRKKATSAIQEIKAWLMGIKKRYQDPPAASKSRKQGSGQPLRPGQKKLGKGRASRLPSASAFKGEWTGPATPTTPSGVCISNSLLGKYRSSWGTIEAPHRPHIRITRLLRLAGSALTFNFLAHSWGFKNVHEWHKVTCEDQKRVIKLMACRGLHQLSCQLQGGYLSRGAVQPHHGKPIR